MQYPFRPGYSSVGVVEQVGRGVSSLQPGDRVASHAPHAQYVTVAEDDTATLPDGIRDEEAAWFAISCVVQIAFRRANIEATDSVVIIGAGILGQLAVQYACSAGPEQVVAIARSSARLRVAKAHGATHTVELPARDAVPRVYELTNGLGANVVFDITGAVDVVQDAFRMATPGGTVILVGDSGYPEEQRLTADLLRKGLLLAGAHFGNASLQEHRDMAQQFFLSVQQGELRVDDLITDRVDPREAPEAYARLSEDPSSALGVVLDWTRL